MEGPFKLDNKVIESKIEQKPGVFILGAMAYNNFIAKLMLSDATDIKQALTAKVGKYDYFYYEYAENADDAYVRLCKYYHVYADKGYKIENRNHPVKPKVCKADCPVCGK